MICHKYMEHVQDMNNKICPKCLQEKLNKLEIMIQTLLLQVNNIEENVVEKIEE